MGWFGAQRSLSVGLRSRPLSLSGYFSLWLRTAAIRWALFLICIKVPYGLVAVLSLLLSELQFHQLGGTELDVFKAPLSSLTEGLLRQPRSSLHALWCSPDWSAFEASREHHMPRNPWGLRRGELLGCSEGRALNTGGNSVPTNNSYGRSEGRVRPKAGFTKFGLILLSIGTIEATACLCRKSSDVCLSIRY